MKKLYLNSPLRCFSECCCVSIRMRRYYMLPNFDLVWEQDHIRLRMSPQQEDDYLWVSSFKFLHSSGNGLFDKIRFQPGLEQLNLAWIAPAGTQKNVRKFWIFLYQSLYRIAPCCKPPPWIFFTRAHTSIYTIYTFILKRQNFIETKNRRKSLTLLDYYIPLYP